MDFTLTHTRFGRSQLHSLGQLTHSRRLDGAPEPDGALRESARTKIRHYRQLYINRPDPIAFMPVAVDTSGRIYDDFSRLLFLHAHRETSAFAGKSFIFWRQHGASERVSERKSKFRSPRRRPSCCWDLGDAPCHGVCVLSCAPHRARQITVFDSWHLQSCIIK